MRKKSIGEQKDAKKEGSVRSFSSDDHHATLGSHHATVQRLSNVETAIKDACNTPIVIDPSLDPSTSFMQRLDSITKERCWLVMVGVLLDP